MLFTFIIFKVLNLSSNWKYFEINILLFLYNREILRVQSPFNPNVIILKKGISCSKLYKYISYDSRACICVLFFFLYKEILVWNSAISSWLDNICAVNLEDESDDCFCSWVLSKISFSGCLILSSICLIISSICLILSSICLIITSLVVIYFIVTSFFFKIISIKFTLFSIISWFNWIVSVRLKFLILYKYLTII